MKKHRLGTKKRLALAGRRRVCQGQAVRPGIFDFEFFITNLIVALLAIALLPTSAFGQGAQGAQIKQRAKELVNQNNVRQGVPPPTPPPPRPAGPVTPGTSAAANSAVLQAQNISKIKAALAALKPGSSAAPEKKQQLIKDLAVAARTTKPSLPTVTKFVDTLAAALGENSLGEPEQERLAQNLNSVFNSKALPASQFDKIIEDVQAILQVGGVKRSVAAGIAGNLKAVGAEVRR
jgi:hypothetical protein